VIRAPYCRQALGQSFFVARSVQALYLWCMKQFFTSFLAILLMTAGVSADAHVYLVRHGERTDDSADSTLSPAGKMRAEALAQVLKSQVPVLSHVYSTDTRRTRATAAPTAAAYGVPVTLYSADDADSFADRLRSLDGTIVVVGHSNTLPALSVALGAVPGILRYDKMTYDLLVRMDLRNGAKPSLVMQHFGAPSPPPADATAPYMP